MLFGAASGMLGLYHFRGEEEREANLKRKMENEAEA
jgi:hypothetical protein